MGSGGEKTLLTLSEYTTLRPLFNNCLKMLKLSDRFTNCDYNTITELEEQYKANKKLKRRERQKKFKELCASIKEVLNYYQWPTRFQAGSQSFIEPEPMWNFLHKAGG